MPEEEKVRYRQLLKEIKNNKRPIIDADINVEIVRESPFRWNPHS